MFEDGTWIANLIVAVLFAIGVVFVCKQDGGGNDADT